MKQNLLTVTILVIISLFVVLFVVHEWEQKESLGIMVGIVVLVVIYILVDTVPNLDKKNTYQFKQQVVSNQKRGEDEEKKNSVVSIPNGAVCITINELSSTEDTYGYTVVQWLEPIKEVN